MYLITLIRPDLLYIVGLCARFMSNLDPDHFKALNRIWQYLCHYKDLALVFNPQRELTL